MSSAGALAIGWTEPPTDNTLSSANGEGVASPGRHYKISQIAITQTKDFRWKVAIFSPSQCEMVQTFNNPDAMAIWLNDIARLHTWALIDGVGL
jgi:hypothetical protein